MTAAYRAGISIAGMVQTLTRSVGANAVRDFATGAQLLNEVSEGRAALGDISRWCPPSTAMASGEPHINRGPAPEPPQHPSLGIDPGLFWRNPEREAVMRREAGLEEPAREEWSPTFMQSRRAG
jgi:hypothetical protein